jgi:hypothetical protein
MTVLFVVLFFILLACILSIPILWRISSIIKNNRITPKKTNISERGKAVVSYIFNVSKIIRREDVSLIVEGDNVIRIYSSKYKFPVIGVNIDVNIDGTRATIHYQREGSLLKESVDILETEQVAG